MPTCLIDVFILVLPNPESSVPSLPPLEGQALTVQMKACVLAWFRGSGQSRWILCFFSGFGYHLGEDEGFGL